MVRLFDIKGYWIVRLFLLLFVLLSFDVSDASAQMSERQRRRADKQMQKAARAKVESFSQSKVKRKNNMYTGKHAWWLNYDFFPSMDKLFPDTLGKPFARHRFSAMVSAGKSGFFFDSPGVKHELGTGIGVGARYSYYFTHYAGVRSGIDVVRSSCSFSVNEGIEDFYVSVDDEGDFYNYNYKLGVVREDVSYYQMEFPVQALFQFGGFVVGLGAKVGMPLKVDYSQTIENLKTSAYYPVYDVFVDDAKVIGCGEFSELKNKGYYSVTPLFVMLSGDLEYQLVLKSKNSIGVGVYADYTVKGVNFKNRNDFDYLPEGADRSSIKGAVVSRSFDVPVSIDAQSLLSSTSNKTGKRILGETKCMNFGVRLTYNINRSFYVKKRKGIVKFEE